MWREKLILEKEKKRLSGYIAKGMGEKGGSLESRKENRKEKNGDE